MPGLGRYQGILDCTFFLFRSKEDAFRRANSGGTGFVIGIPSERRPDDFHYMYGVTNWHVACAGAFSTVSVNTIDGKFDVIELEPSDWVFQPGGHDIAVVPLWGLNPRLHKVWALAPNWILSKEIIQANEINAGDDVFMAGRFVDFDGLESNVTSLRFGHISILSAPIRQRTGFTGDSVVIDLHSRSGFSGSPVFVYRTHGSIFASEPRSIIIGGHLMYLLGIHWGQFPEVWEIKEVGKGTIPFARESSLITDGKYVQGMSGMTCVCPAEAIWGLLNSPAMKDQRAEHDKTLNW